MKLKGRPVKSVRGYAAASNASSWFGVSAGEALPSADPRVRLLWTMRRADSKRVLAPLVRTKDLLFVHGRW
jgi:hypothetical protein